MSHKIVVIGSTALEFHLDIGRTPKDVDYVMSWSTYAAWLENLRKVVCVEADYPISNGKKQVVKTADTIYEIEIAWSGSTAEEIIDIATRDGPLLSPLGSVFSFYIAPVHLLYALKMSHRYLRNSPHFKKTMNDIKLLRKEFGPLIKYPLFLKRREDETYDYQHPDLTVNKDAFFKNEVFYKYDHDDIHEAIKLESTPAYKDIICDGEQVKCSKEKWDALREGRKLFCALEECYVLSLERGLIPNDFKTDPYKTFKVALMKVCTSITSGWFREWCWENHNMILDSYDSNYTERFFNARDANQIRNFKHDCAC